MKNYDEMDMRQTSQAEDEKQEIDGMNLYCLISTICSILGFPIGILKGDDD